MGTRGAYSYRAEPDICPVRSDCAGKKGSCTTKEKDDHARQESLDQALPRDHMPN